MLESNGLVVHWDGKMLPQLTGKEKVDRLPILVANNEFEQLLGVPFLEQSTGEEIAEAVFSNLDNWGMLDKVEAMCFDTTATNTGRYSGACVILEQK